jgi:hypothetical protein
MPNEANIQTFKKLYTSKIGFPILNCDELNKTSFGRLKKKEVVQYAKEYSLLFPFSCDYIFSLLY